MKSSVLSLASALFIHHGLATPSCEQSTLEIDLGYSVYQGTTNITSRVNSWKGIRFAKPPIGDLRWQTPRPPSVNRTEIIKADVYASGCPQSLANIGAGAEQLAITYQSLYPGSEDCLFLNVQAPANQTNLPVLIWIHGGGYGLSNNQYDFNDIITTNGNNFVAVSTQYRLGAFGFLSSEDVKRSGVLKAGLLDQQAAFRWVQQYIHLFGGDPTKVTISGQSAGAGSVMLHNIAYGGTLGTSLYTSSIAQSPYLPKQYYYNNQVPTQLYAAFAREAGCATKQDTFACLVSQNTTTLQHASAIVSSSKLFGTWSSLPVTDVTFLQNTPSQQLLSKRVNGKRILTGNNANEAAVFVPPNITTENDLISWIQASFPLFITDDISKLILYCPGTNSSDNPNAVKFATNGLSGPSALNVSSFATGQQQRAAVIIAESMLVCSSYWLAQAYTGNGRVAYKYQYSVPGAKHGDDEIALFGPIQLIGDGSTQGPDFVKAFRTSFGNFVTTGNPSVSTAIAVGASAGIIGLKVQQPIADWPAFTSANPYQINFNQTGGREFVKGQG